MGQHGRRHMRGALVVGFLATMVAMTAGTPAAGAVSYGCDGTAPAGVAVEDGDATCQAGWLAVAASVQATGRASASDGAAVAAGPVGEAAGPVAVAAGSLRTGAEGEHLALGAGGLSSFTDSDGAAVGVAVLFADADGDEAAVAFGGLEGRSEAAGLALGLGAFESDARGGEAAVAVAGAESDASADHLAVAVGAMADCEARDGMFPDLEPGVLFGICW